MIVLKNVLVATDFEPASDAALAYGRALARNFGASLHLLHVAENQFLRPSPTDPTLIKMAWYLRAETWLFDWRDRLYAFVKALPAWQRARAMVQAVRRWMRELLGMPPSKGAPSHEP